MSVHRIEGSIVDTDRAKQKWNEDRRWDGSNHISVATGSQWVHQTLYCSRKNRYYTVTESAQHEGRPSAEWVSPQEAARWLLVNGHQIPEDLAAAAEEVSE